MKLESLWFIPSLLIGTFAFADEEGSLGNGVLKKTVAGRFYSSQETIDHGFPFSDVVVVSGELVFLSGLVGTDLEGELVDGGLIGGASLDVKSFRDLCAIGSLSSK